MTTVQLENVRKEFGDVVAVEDMDLEINDGEFVVVVGPSGCGKSTTLRLIAGLEHVTEGRIQMGGRDVTEEPPENRNIAMVFQNYALYPHMTAKRNITFGMKDAGEFTDDEIETLVDEAAATLDIEDLLDRKPKALSGGERQRVALGRAIVRDPSVFLMDEPLSNLDAKLRIQMRAELAKLHEQLQTTTIYVTHDQTEAMTLGERVVVMNDGEIQQVAVPQQLYDYPENRFVAGFIGDPAMNMFEVELESRDGRYVADHPRFEIELPAKDQLADHVNQTVTLGVRPEHLHLSNGGTEYPHAMRATITVTEPLGDHLLLECRVGEDVFRVQSTPRLHFDPGDEIDIHFEPERLHIFDHETGETVYHSDSEFSVTQQPIGSVGE
jgi:multiple sugar transport system ATP-binding protein